MEASPCSSLFHLFPANPHDPAALEHGPAAAAAGTARLGALGADPGPEDHPAGPDPRGQRAQRQPARQHPTGGNSWEFWGFPIGNGVGMSNSQCPAGNVSIPGNSEPLKGSVVPSGQAGSAPTGATALGGSRRSLIPSDPAWIPFPDCQ